MVELYMLVDSKGVPCQMGNEGKVLARTNAPEGFVFAGTKADLQRHIDREISRDEYLGLHENVAWIKSLRMERVYREQDMTEKEDEILSLRNQLDTCWEGIAGDDL